MITVGGLFAGIGGVELGFDQEKGVMMMDVKTWLNELLDMQQESFSKMRRALNDALAKAAMYDSLNQLWHNDLERATRAEKALRDIEEFCRNTDSEHALDN